MTMSGRGEPPVIVAALLVALATVIVLLRCYAHISLMPCFGLDDGLAIAALVFSSTLPLKSILISLLTWIYHRFS